MTGESDKRHTHILYTCIIRCIIHLPCIPQYTPLVYTWKVYTRVYYTRVYWAEGPHEVPGSAAWDPGESTCVPRCSALRPGYSGPRNSGPVRQQPSATAAQCYNGPVRRQRPSATTAAHTAALPQPACARGRRRTSAALPPPLYRRRSGHRGGEGTRAMTIAGLNDRQKDEEHRGEEGRVGG